MKRMLASLLAPGAWQSALAGCSEELLAEEAGYRIYIGGSACGYPISRAWFFHIF